MPQHASISASHTFTHIHSNPERSFMAALHQSVSLALWAQCQQPGAAGWSCATPPTSTGALAGCLHPTQAPRAPHGRPADCSLWRLWG